MPYLGNIPAENYASFDKQTITGDGGTSYTLDHPVGSAQEVAIFVNNVRQEPGVAYTVTGTSLTMTGDVESTDDFYAIFIGKAVQTTAVPSDASISLDDNIKVQFGAGNDLQIYHDGSHSVIHDNGTGHLKLRAGDFRLNNAADTGQIISATSGAEVTLYHNNSAKLATTSSGVSITGDISVSGSGLGKVLQVKQDIATSVINLDTGTSNWSDTGIAVSITPSSTDSDILIHVMLNGIYHALGGSSGYHHVRVAKVVSGTTSALTNANTNWATEIGRGQGQGEHDNIGFSFVDVPATTSAITYKVQAIQGSGSNNFYMNDTAATSALVCIEIDGGLS